MMIRRSYRLNMLTIVPTPLGGVPASRYLDIDRSHTHKQLIVNMRNEREIKQSTFEERDLYQI